jgi:hypothetical protein
MFTITYYNRETGMSQAFGGNVQGFSLLIERIDVPALGQRMKERREPDAIPAG